MIGWMAASLAGHDKNKIYIIIEETDECVWLADGKTRLTENPKCKKKKHIQIIKRYADEELAHILQQRLDGKQSDWKPVRINETIKRAIKLYKQNITEHE